jgi:hypothetical protein
MMRDREVIMQKTTLIRVMGVNGWIFDCYGDSSRDLAVEFKSIQSLLLFTLVFAVVSSLWHSGANNPFCRGDLHTIGITYRCTFRLGWVIGVTSGPKAYLFMHSFLQRHQPFSPSSISHSAGEREIFQGTSICGLEVKMQLFSNSP